MVIEQRSWSEAEGWKVTGAAQFSQPPQLVLVFGARSKIADSATYDEIRALYPDAATHILLASTAGEILGSEVADGTLAVTALGFERSSLAFATAPASDFDASEAAGKQLAAGLPHDGLVHAMVYSDGLTVNGTALVRGILSGLPEQVSVTGGLVGDGPDFKQTVLGLDGPAQSGLAVLIGFYGEKLRVGYGSLGGWDPFGPERIITKSKGNVLYEVDGEPVLPLYKKYLGELAADLPGSGLLFPLRLRQPSADGGADVETVRTILSIDEAAQSIIFAGDMPEGTPAALMKANFERLIDGAAGAATMSASKLTDGVDFALLISCVGRKLVLKERTVEELEAVRSVVGEHVPVTGFYSYGEISPRTPTERQCQLHNQTMTITTFKES